MPGRTPGLSPDIGVNNPGRITTLGTYCECGYQDCGCQGLPDIDLPELAPLPTMIPVEVPGVSNPQGGATYTVVPIPEAPAAPGSAGNVGGAATATPEIPPSVIDPIEPFDLPPLLEPPIPCEFRVPAGVCD